MLKCAVNHFITVFKHNKNNKNISANMQLSAKWLSPVQICTLLICNFLCVQAIEICWGTSVSKKKWWVVGFFCHFGVLKVHVGIIIFYEVTVLVRELLQLDSKTVRFKTN